MIPVVWILVATIGGAPQASHEGHRSHYAGLEGRELKALSNEEIRGLQSGAGMSLALVAELNHHPGPKHVLELQDELALSPEQVQETQAAFERMHSAAARLGSAILDGERELESLFRSGEGAAAIAPRVIELGRLRGELRWTHLEAHLVVRDVLTEEQARAYDTLRGYASDGGTPAPAAPGGERPAGPGKE